MYGDTITVFNRKEGSRGDTWYPSVLRGVQVSMDRAAIMARYGAESADNAIVHVRYEVDGDDRYISGKLYLPPKQWDQMDNPAEAVTFTAGNRFDFFWVGDWRSETPVQDADYAGTGNPDFYAYMNKTHDHVFAITSVSGPFKLIPHFEILGK